MNRVQIIGNLGKDPEIKVTNGGKTVAKLSVAVNRKYTDPQGEEKQFTDWINVVAWGNLAEAVGNELKKGDRVFVEGRYSTRSYEDKSGSKRYITEVIANTIAKPIGGKEKPVTKFTDFGQAEYEPGEVPKKEYNQDDIPF
nr:MAG TPA: Single strand binding protein [Caudoviricetes sp.]